MHPHVFRLHASTVAARARRVPSTPGLRCSPSAVASRRRSLALRRERPVGRLLPRPRPRPPLDLDRPLALPLPRAPWAPVLGSLLRSRAYQTRPSLRLQIRAYAKVHLLARRTVHRARDRARISAPGRAIVAWITYGRRLVEACPLVHAPRRRFRRARRTRAERPAANRRRRRRRVREGVVETDDDRVGSDVVVARLVAGSTSRNAGFSHHRPAIPRVLRAIARAPPSPRAIRLGASLRRGSDGVHVERELVRTRAQRLVVQRRRHVERITEPKAATGPPTRPSAGGHRRSAAGRPALVLRAAGATLFRILSRVSPQGVPARTRATRSRTRDTARSTACGRNPTRGRRARRAIPSSSSMNAGVVTRGATP